MKTVPFAMIACAVVGIAGLLALPWAGDEITMLDVIRTRAHGHQVGYFIVGPLLVAIVVGGLSVRRSRRWQTGLAGFLLLIPALLSAVAKNAAMGAHIGLAGSALAAIAAIALTVRPVGPSLRRCAIRR